MLNRTLHHKADLRITREEARWSPAKYLALFGGSFGAIWLFLEPLFAVVGGSGPLAPLGIWRFPLLIVVAAGITISIAKFKQCQVHGQTHFVPVEVILTASGVRYTVEVPKDMRIKEFTERLLEDIPEHVPPEVAKLYDHTLLVKKCDKTASLQKALEKGNELNTEEAALLIKALIEEDNTSDFEELSNDMTLAEAGIKAGGEVKILSTIKPECKQRVQIRIRVPHRDKKDNGSSFGNIFLLPSPQPIG